MDKRNEYNLLNAQLRRIKRELSVLGWSSRVFISSDIDYLVGVLSLNNGQILAELSKKYYNKDWKLGICATTELQGLSGLDGRYSTLHEVLVDDIISKCLQYISTYGCNGNQSSCSDWYFTHHSLLFNEVL